MGKLAGFVLGLLGTVPRIWAQDPNGSPQTNGPPGWMIGDFEDDYGNRFRVGADKWIQYPGSEFEVDTWVTSQRFLIARNAAANESASGLWTRIDWVELAGMAPYRWAFCFTAYRAASRTDAINTPAARTTSPRDGCSGYPFSRMKPAGPPVEPPR